MTRPDLASARRVLIVKLSAIGDVIHALPVAAALGEAFPHLEISWAVEEPFAPLLTGNPFLQEIIALPKLNGRRLRSASFRRGYRDKLHNIRRANYDVSLDLQGLTKSAVVAVASGAKVRLGYHWLREAARWLEQPVPLQTDSVHIVDQYLDVARFCGANPTTIRFPFFIPEADDDSAVTMLRESGLPDGAPFVTINPASAQKSKEWGAEKYAALVDSLYDSSGTPAVLVTADKIVAAQVAGVAQRPFVNLAGRTNLKQLAAVLKRGAVHICGDTGSGHLAAALGRPVVSLFGPTNPLRSCPYGQAENVVQIRAVCDVACAGSRCVLPRPRCMDAITVQDIAAKVEPILAKGEQT